MVILGSKNSRLIHSIWYTVWCFWLQKAMAPHSSTLVWKIPWTEEPGRLQSMGSLGVRHNWATSLSLFTFMHWRKKWQPTPVFLPGESQGREPGGLPSVGSHRVGHNWSNLAAAAAVSCLWFILQPFYIHWEFSLMPVIILFPNRYQGLNLGLLHCRQMLYHLR